MGNWQTIASEWLGLIYIDEVKALEVFNIHPFSINEKGFIIHARDGSFEMQAIVQFDTLHFITIPVKQIIHLIHSRLVATRGHADVNIFSHHQYIASIYCGGCFDEKKFAVWAKRAGDGLR